MSRVCERIWLERARLKLYLQSPRSWIRQPSHSSSTPSSSTSSTSTTTTIPDHNSSKEKCKHRIGSLMCLPFRIEFCVKQGILKEEWAQKIAKGKGLMSKPPSVAKNGNKRKNKGDSDFQALEKKVKFV